jgi:hypothetical protein
MEASRKARNLPNDESTCASAFFSSRRERGIYLEGIATGNATFEASAPEWEVWDAAHLPYGRITMGLHCGTDSPAAIRFLWLFWGFVAAQDGP